MTFSLIHYHDEFLSGETLRGKSASSSVGIYRNTSHNQLSGLRQNTLPPSLIFHNSKINAKYSTNHFLVLEHQDFRLMGNLPRKLPIKIKESV